jgi:hypothetical protein
VTATIEQTGQSPLIEFWADSTEVTAGTCTNFHWRTKNVSEVVFGGTVRPFEGQDSACPCSTQRYTLTATLPNGSREKRQVTINVSGTCTTPLPVDTTPPPAPAPDKPTNGSTLSNCVGSTTLMWNAVSDPSGIAEYQLQVQRHAGDFNWSTVSSPAGLGGTDTSVSVECGWYYRWRVRAVDGAGNTGPWSDWYTFAVPLI